MRFVLRRLLHGFRESPGIAPGSHGARMAPQRRAFPRRCAGYSFVTSIIYAPKVNVNDRAGQIHISAGYRYSHRFRSIADGADRNLKPYSLHL